MSQYEMGSMENIVNNYAISLYSGRWQLELLWWSFWNVWKYWITIVCTRKQYSVVGQLYFNNKWAKNLIGKEIIICGYQRWGDGFWILLPMQEPQKMKFWSLGEEDPLEKEIATHSSILARIIPQTKGAWWVTVIEVTKSQTQLRNWAGMQTVRGQGGGVRWR